jgi:hypothetical protein
MIRNERSGLILPEAFIVAVTDAEALKEQGKR